MRGRARLPPSKSLTQRAYALALLTAEPVVVKDPLDADDPRLFLGALEALGCSIERLADSVEIRRGELSPRAARLDCGSSGTLLRFLTALVATLPGEWRLDGSERLHARPIGPLVAALRQLGVTIDCLERDGFAPLVVHGGTLCGGRIALDAGESSQYVSALLLAGQRAAGAIEIELTDLVSAPYLELTIDLLVAHGGSVERHGALALSIEPRELRGGTIAIEPDLSAAAYPAAAAALTAGEVLLEGVSLASRQGDRRLLALLAEMGARVVEEADGVRVAGGPLRALTVDASDIPDQVPTLAALAPFAHGTTRISRVAHLRLKESNRLEAMATELRRAGAEVELLSDGLVIPGLWAEREPPSNPVEIDPHDDHRIAMAMALVGLRRPELSIRDPQVVAKSWPSFWAELAEWTGAVPFVEPAR